MSEILTVGALKRIMSKLDDDCFVEINVGDTGYGDNVRAEVNHDGEGAWLTIVVDE